MSRRKLDQRRLVTAAIARPQPIHQDLAAGRLWAATRFPYLAGALFAMRVAPSHRPGIMGVDQYWNLRVDPDLLKDWSSAEIGSVLVHHVSHLLRNHADRAHAMFINQSRAARWRAAADAEIEDDLADAGLSPPYRPILPADLGCEPHQVAEQYFSAPWPDPENADPDTMTESRLSAALGGCGSGSDGIPRPWDEQDGIPPEQADLRRYQTAREIIAYHGKQPGTVPGGLLRWAGAVLGTRTDWRAALAAEIRRGVAATAGLVDYSYRRPSRRAGAVSGVVLPWLVHPVPDVVIVIDTSASVDEEMLGQALGEVDGILRRLGQRRVRVIPCDAVTYDVQRVGSARTIELIGGGGTDMRRGIATAIALRPRADVVVVLTDGYTPWPDQPAPGVCIVAGLMEGGSATPPRWMRVVRIYDAR